jgi:hypothetical protein
MKFYNTLFFVVYKTVYFLQGGYFFQPRSNIILSAVIVLSFLENLNVFIFFKDPIGDKFWLPLAGFLTVNFFVFYYFQKATSILNSYDEKPPERMTENIAIAYVSLVLFVFIISRFYY